MSRTVLATVAREVKRHMEPIPGPIEDANPHAASAALWSSARRFKLILWPHC